MPIQETFFEQSLGNKTVVVVKSYDRVYAQETFLCMNDDAQKYLWKTLEPEKFYEPDELPSLGAPDGQAETFMWDELLEQAREDGNVLSFFIVRESVGNRAENLYVSPDWPSAEAFAKVRLAEPQGE